VGDPDDALADGDNSGTKRIVGFIGTRSTPVRSVKPSERTVEPSPPAAATRAVPELEPVNSAVYRTSVEQLYQDYDANEVAIQSKIHGSPIRVSGSVAEINEDTSGHPVVTLHTGGGNAEMLLTDDQRSPQRNYRRKMRRNSMQQDATHCGKTARQRLRLGAR